MKCSISVARLLRVLEAAIALAYLLGLCGRIDQATTV